MITDSYEGHINSSDGVTMAPTNKADQQADDHDGFAERAADWFLGPDPFVGFSRQDVLRVIGWIGQQALKRPMALVENQAALVGALIRILAGQSELAPEQGDKRFQDPTWKDNPFYRIWMQGYLAWRDSLNAFVDGAGFDATSAARARFVLSLLTEAVAPTNFLPGNPAALKKMMETGGSSLVRGLQNLLQDIMTNGGMPAQVDKSAFQVGKNLATTPGAVVFRNEVCELIQYAPTTGQVYARPLLLIAPQINKYYILDLSPGKSLIEYTVRNGVQAFAVSWRNPTAAQCDWGLETYLYSIMEAIDAAREITGSRDVNILGACGGAITMMALLAHLAAKGRGSDSLVNAMTLMVALLDTQAGSQLGLFATKETVALAKRNSQMKGVKEGDEIARVFTWLRPNDLVWNYWVNNYLMGDDPPAFDLLYWSNDLTRLPARLHGEFLDLFLANPFKNPGRFSVFGTPIDLAKVTCDAYIVAGLTDRITPWKGCYSTTQMLGGDCQFILSSNGHVRTVVNPPGNPKARFFTNPQFPASHDEWLAGAEQQSGSWWDHWRDWIVARSGESREASKAMGNEKYPQLDPAPGTYVFET
jgi:poly[(R)-3-hydroxyalkanoate] polymerase subunit PhaC